VNTKFVVLVKENAKELLIFLLRAWVQVQTKFFRLYENNWDPDGNEYIFMVTMMTEPVVKVTKTRV
jgi:hypothetical protein